MLRCSKEAFACCTTAHLCGRRDEATFIEGSECDRFNQSVRSQPVTAADRIRSMTDFELVDAIEELLPKLWEAGDQSLSEQICDGQGDCGTDGNCNQQRHRACILRFLQRPADLSDDICFCGERREDNARDSFQG